MKKGTSMYRTPVLFFRREGFGKFLANIGIESNLVFPPLEVDPLDFESSGITFENNFSYPYIMYDIDMSSYSNDRRNTLRSMLNRHQPDFF